MDDRSTQFERLYGETSTAVWAYVHRHARDASRAEDLFQQVYLEALRRPSAVAGAASAKAWLLGIARNLVRSTARRDARVSAVSLDFDPPARPADGADDAQRNAMREAMARLPDHERDVLMLRLQDDLRYDEISTVLGIPVGTVRSRLHAAVRRLRERCAAKETMRPGGGLEREKALRVPSAGERETHHGR